MDKKELIVKLGGIVDDFLTASKYTNFRQIMKELNEKLKPLKAEIDNMVAENILPYDTSFFFYRLWCYFDEATERNYNIKEYYKKDCQNVTFFYKKVIDIINNKE